MWIICRCVIETEPVEEEEKKKPMYIYILNICQLSLTILVQNVVVNGSIVNLGLWNTTGMRLVVFFVLPVVLHSSHFSVLLYLTELCEEVLIVTDPNITSIGSNLKVITGSNSCHLSAWSVSILPDCKNAVLNTTKINFSSMILSFIREKEGSLDDSGSGWSWIGFRCNIVKSGSRTFVVYSISVIEVNGTSIKNRYYLASFLKFSYHLNLLNPNSKKKN
ncbi:hypothetical protein VNO77_02691 [Canavalia gladiata]|uniref:Uncharacterized protein n=1 Tax=Canavalia gladiata TaxID=3824 RepID=A0AAN9MYN9_CANGL